MTVVFWDISRRKSSDISRRKNSDISRTATHRSFHAQQHNSHTPQGGSQTAKTCGRSVEIFRLAELHGRQSRTVRGGPFERYGRYGAFRWCRTVGRRKRCGRHWTFRPPARGVGIVGPERGRDERVVRGLRIDWRQPGRHVTGQFAHAVDDVDLTSIWFWFFDVSGSVFRKPCADSERWRGVSDGERRGGAMGGDGERWGAMGSDGERWGARGGRWFSIHRCPKHQKAEPVKHKQR